MVTRERCLAILFLGLVAIISTTHAYENILKTVVEPNPDAEEWDYSDGPKGPAHWGDKWKTCGEGQNQSPVNIDTSELVYEEDLDAPVIHSYTDQDAYVFNNGHSPQVIWPAGWMYVNGRNYTVEGFLFHSPSEHTIDGIRYPLEMQIVHRSDDGNVAVVSILSSVRNMVNAWVAQFWDQIPSETNGEPIPVGVLSPNGFRVNFSKYYRYTGSRTTPDCKEDVVWTVLSTVYEISPGQLEHLQSIFPENNRPTQPLGNRKVSYPKVSV